MKKKSVIQYEVFQCNFLPKVFSVLQHLLRKELELDSFQSELHSLSPQIVEMALNHYVVVAVVYNQRKKRGPKHTD